MLFLRFIRFRDLHEGEGVDQKNGADRAKSQAHVPKPAAFRQGGNGCDRDGDLKHGHTAGQVLMALQPLTIGFFFSAGLSCQAILFPFVFVHLISESRGDFLVVQFDEVCVGLEDRKLHAVGLKLAPGIGRSDPINQCFVRVHSAKQCGHGRQRSQKGRAQRHPSDPLFLRVMRFVMNGFVEMFGWDFNFFHGESLSRLGLGMGFWQPAF